MKENFQLGFILQPFIYEYCLFKTVLNWYWNCIGTLVLAVGIYSWFDQEFLITPKGSWLLARSYFSENNKGKDKYFLTWFIMYNFCKSNAIFG